MNNMVKILLSAMMVSLSALIVPMKGQNEGMDTESVVTQMLTIGTTENQDYEIMSYSRKFEIDVIREEMNQKMIEIESIEDREEWFLEYKDILFDYVEWFGFPQTIFDAYTEEEITYICRAVETECYDQDFMSKCNVASVILNRINLMSMR